MEDIKIGRWVREDGKMPRCNRCGYYWIENVVGPVGEGVSDLKLFGNYCPNCGAEMRGKED